MPDASGGLDARGLRRSYPAAAGELVVLRDATFRLALGDAASVVGPSGCGKSTLLHLLGGLDRPTGGRVTVTGVDPHALGEVELARYRNRTVGFVFQDHHLLPQLSALENVLVPTLADGGATPELRCRAEELLDRVGLAARRTHRPAELSGGERQRVAIARALLREPPLLLCDEPTGNLDPASAADVGALLLELGRRPTGMLLMVTHSAELAGRADRRFSFRDGALHEQLG